MPPETSEPTRVSKPRARADRRYIDWHSVPGLGVHTDDAVAADLGCSRERVTQNRLRIGVACSRVQIEWDNGGLGTDTDANIAKRHGVAISTVREQRGKRSIMSYRKTMILAAKHANETKLEVENARRDD
jgi:hypothetical protein